MKSKETSQQPESGNFDLERFKFLAQQIAPQIVEASAMQALTLDDVTRQLTSAFVHFPFLFDTWRQMYQLNMVDLCVGLFFASKKTFDRIAKEKQIEVLASDVHKAFPYLQELAQNPEILSWVRKDLNMLLGANVQPLEIAKTLQFPYFDAEDIYILLTHPNSQYLREVCSFADICRIKSMVWKRRSTFSLGFLINFPNFTKNLAQYMLGKTSDDFFAKDWAERLQTFDHLMALIGRAGVTDAQITAQLLAENEERDEVKNFVPEVFIKNPTKEIALKLHTGQNLFDDWQRRQIILAEQGSAPEWHQTPEQLHRLRFLESERNPLRYLHVSHGWEIEFFEMLRNHDQFQNVENGKFIEPLRHSYQQILDPSVYGVLHHSGVMNLGDQTGEISPGPWYLLEHSNLFFSRFLDAGLLDAYDAMTHTCHWNIGLRTFEMFAAVCHMMRATGYSFRALPELLKHSPGKFFKIANFEKPSEENLPHKYGESKQFRFFSVDNHFKFMNDGVKLAQAAKAAEQIIRGPGASLQGRLASINDELLLTLDEAQINNANFVSRDQRKLALVWVKVFQAFLLGAEHIKAPNMWRKSVPSLEEYHFEHELQTVFPTELAHLDMSRADRYFPPNEKLFGAPLNINGVRYANFIQFTRRIIEAAAQEVDQIMDNSYQEFGQILQHICKNYEESDSKRKMQENGKLILYCLHNYSIPKKMPMRRMPVKSDHFAIASYYRDSFFRLLQDFRSCGMV